jgi:hypothetical protein
VRKTQRLPLVFSSIRWRVRPDLVA